MFAKTLGTNWFTKTVYRSLLKSLEIESDKQILIRTTDWLLENMVIYLYWSGEYRKISIWLRLTVVRSGDIVLLGGYLLLYYVYPNNVDTSRQNNNMIWIVLYFMCRYKPFREKQKWWKIARI